MINDLGNQLQVLVDNTAPNQRLAGFRELFREDFDIPTLGRFVLGRDWWALNPWQQQEFLGLFENYVVLTYSDRLSEYAEDGDFPKVIGIRSDPDGDGAIVSSEIVSRSASSPGAAPAARPITVDWRLTDCNGAYKITDVVIDGLSMAANGRSELAAAIERNGGQVEAALAVIRQQIAIDSRR